MSEDDKKSPQGFGANSAIFVALVATGAYFYAQQAPLEVLRPPPLESRIEHKFHAQDIEARLWEDPFDAVARQLKKVDGEEKKACDEAWAKKPPMLPLHCRPPLIDEGGNLRYGIENTRIIAVTAPGASYFEDSETRRRLRYAVLSGLHVQHYEPQNEQHIGYFRPRARNQIGLPNAIPFEWLELETDKVKKENTIDGKSLKSNLLLLWIDENVLGDDQKPLEKLLEMRNSLCAFNTDMNCESYEYQVIGPYSSKILKYLAGEINDCHTAQCKTQFYSYGTTVGETDLPRVPQNILRAIGSDDALADAIVKELELRGIKPAANNKPHIALVSDRDTLYGRRVTDAFERKLATGFSPVKLTYIRGVDGTLSSMSAEVKKSSANSEQSGNDKHLIKTQEDLKTLEHAFGQDQFDYLRRLAANLKDKDDELRRGEERRLSAIGVLGNDVFDKLLAMRALKPLFPEAVFFTTDYDAALAGREELKWTRNLIIASSYGPTVSNDLQGDIPPFRSTYQTAAFLATLAAVQDGKSEAASVLKTRIEKGLRSPRIFEIDRRGGFLSLPTQSDSSGIHPSISSVYSPLSNSEQVSFAVVILAVAIVFLSFYWNGLLLPFLRTTWLGLAVVMLLAAIVVFWWNSLADWATAHGQGEPIAWAQGVSMWPSVALRAIAGLMAVVLTNDAWKELSANIEDIEKRRLKIDANGASKAPRFRIETGRGEQGALRRFLEAFSYRLIDEEAENDKDKDVFVNDVWKTYIAKERLKLVAVRVSFYVVMMLVLFFSLVSAYGWPNTPWRGQHGATIYYAVTVPAVLTLLILVFLVFDSTLLCLRFVEVLRRHRTHWPDNTHLKFRKKLNVEHPLLDDWIDLRFIALRTRCISKLIYYPFAIFALMIMSRSTAFAEFAVSPPVVVTQFVGFVALFGCAMALCFSAEKARKTTMTRLMEGIAAAKASSGEDQSKSGNEGSGRDSAASIVGDSAPRASADQLESLLKLVDGLREGSFVPLSQQPPIRALLLPIGGLGWTALLDYRLLPGL